MCGIAGLVSNSSSPQNLQLRMMRMLDSLKHRGPDDADLSIINQTVLGHRRLSIIDLEGGRQPIKSEDDRYSIVCNGEIYNYKEIRKSLLAKGHQFRTESDCEVVLHLYEDKGASCLDDLRGMFAFAIHDRDSGELFMARDHLGQKPLFFCEQNGDFAFASEIKGLLPLLQSAPEVEPQALLQYLSLRVIAPPLSMFKGIKKLAPGHWMRLDADGRLETGRYWDFGYSDKWRGGEKALVDALEAELIEAVQLHLVADVEVGAFLSGGLDSTLVTAIAGRHGKPGSLPTFTIGIPYAQYDEAPAARMVADAFATEHHEKSFVPSMRQRLPQLLACLDEPSDPLSICSYEISAMASQRVKVVLGGDGGDELFGGYDRYYGHIYAGLYGHVPETLRRGLIGPMLGFLPDGKWYKSAGHQLKWLHQGAFLQGGERHAANLGYFYFDQGRRADLIGPELSSTARDFDPYAVIVDAYNNAPAEHPVDRMLYADSRIRLPDHSVMILDRTSMAHGLEARSPFMDHKLAGFCARLPVNMKVRSRSTRYIQKKLAKRYLPGEVLNRKKQGFSSALGYLLRKEYDQLFSVFLDRSMLAQAGYLVQSGIDALKRQHLSGQHDHSQRLWLLLNSEAWYRMYVLGMDAEQLTRLISQSV